MFQYIYIQLWKARLAAYETLIKQFQLAEDEDDEVFADWNRFVTPPVAFIIFPLLTSGQHVSLTALRY